MKKITLLALGLISASAFAQSPAKPSRILSSNACIGCHADNTKMVGPSFTDVAKRYADKKDAVEYLAGKIKRGGKGVWGDMEMLKQNISEADAKTVASWIVTLSNKHIA